MLPSIQQPFGYYLFRSGARCRWVTCRAENTLTVVVALAELLLAEPDPHGRVAGHEHFVLLAPNRNPGFRPTALDRRPACFRGDDSIQRRRRHIEERGDLIERALDGRELFKFRELDLDPGPASRTLTWSRLIQRVTSSRNDVNQPLHHQGSHEQCQRRTEPREEQTRTHVQRAIRSHPRRWL